MGFRDSKYDLSLVKGVIRIMITTEEQTITQIKVLERKLRLLKQNERSKRNYESNKEERIKQIQDYQSRNKNKVLGYRKRYYERTGT